MHVQRLAHMDTYTVERPPKKRMVLVIVKAARQRFHYCDQRHQGHSSYETDCFFESNQNICFAILVHLSIFSFRPMRPKLHCPPRLSHGFASSLPPTPCKQKCCRLQLIPCLIGNLRGKLK